MTSKIIKIVNTYTEYSQAQLTRTKTEQMLELYQ